MTNIMKSAINSQERLEHQGYKLDNILQNLTRTNYFTEILIKFELIDRHLKIDLQLRLATQFHPAQSPVE